MQFQVMPQRGGRVGGKGDAVFRLIKRGVRGDFMRFHCDKRQGRKGGGEEGS